MTYPDTTYPNTPRHIDIPVKLDDVNAVFSVAALSFEGDLPASLFHLWAHHGRHRGLGRDI